MTRAARWLPPVLLLVAVLAPVVPLALSVFAGPYPYPSLLPSEVSLRGVQRLTDPRSQIPRALATSLLLALTVAVLACLIGLPAGRAIGLHRFRGRRVVQFLLLAPVVVPALAVTLGLQVVMIRVGLADTVAGVILVQLMPAVPYAATLLGGAFANLDLEYEQQARALGASPSRVLLHVTLPLVRPALVATAVFAFLISWTEYVLTLLVGGGQVTTLPLLLFAAIGSSDTTVASALALLVVLPPLVLVLGVTRALTGGSAGAVGLVRL